MVYFLVHCFENIVRSFWDWFISPDVLKKATSTTQLIKLDVMDKNIRNRDYDFGFSIRHELHALKQKGEITDFKLQAFTTEIKSFISTLCNHLISKIPLTSYFARCTKSLNPVNMVEIHDVCLKGFHHMLHSLLIATI